MIFDRRHAVVRNDSHGRARIVLLRFGIDSPKLLVIPLKTFLDLCWILAIHVQKHVHLAQIEKEEGGFFALQILQRLIHDFRISLVMIGIDLVRNLRRLQVVKN